MGNTESRHSSCLIRNQVPRDTRVLCLASDLPIPIPDGTQFDPLSTKTFALNIVVGHGLEQLVTAPFFDEAGLRLAVHLGGSDARLIRVPNGATLFLRDYRGEITARICCEGNDVWELAEHSDALALFDAVDVAAAAAEVQAEVATIETAVDEKQNIQTTVGSTTAELTNKSAKLKHDSTGMAESATPPHECFCPISQDIFVDPVLAADGFTYERACIEEWWRRRGLSSPMTGQPISNMALTPNLAIRALCEEWRDSVVGKDTLKDNSSFYQQHLPALCDMFSQLPATKIEEVCTTLVSEGVEDLDVCVRQLLHHASSDGGQAAAVSRTPVCCAAEARDGAGNTSQSEESAAVAAALLEPASSVPHAWPEEREAIFATLLELRFSPVRARKAIDVGDADSIEDAVVWLEKHQDDPEIDTPMEVLSQRESIQLALDVLRVATVPAAHRLQCYRSLHQILGKIVMDPSSERLRKIRLQNSTFRERILRFPQAVSLLRKIGFTQGDYWTSATQREPCLEFLLPIDSDNISSQRFVRAYSLIDHILDAPDDWLAIVPEAQPEIRSEWAQKDLDTLVTEGSPSEDGTARLPREYIAELHERRTQDPRNFHQVMVAAGKQPNPAVIDVRRRENLPDEAEVSAQALCNATASSSSQSRSYRRLSERFAGKRHFNLQDIENMRVEEAIANCPQYAREWYQQRGTASSYTDLVTRSYDPQYLGLKAIDDTNIFRGQNQMPPLRWSQAIADIAAEHARQMARGEMPFSHKGFNDRVQRYPFPYLSAAENLAWNSGVADAAGQAVQGWIHSPGHRKNLLGAFDVCGIGVARSSSGEFFFTQLFGRTLGGALC